MFTHQDIARYYDLSEVHYRLFWKLDTSRSLHYGYWDSSTKDFHEALLNINRVLADKVSITKDDNVLDAGCGVGGSSLWLAGFRGCQVTGISLNEKQVQKANAAAQQAGLQNRVTFAQKDYLNTGYPSESFDVVWGIESVCYADDKSAFLNEASRLLRKGGRLVIADFFQAENLPQRAAAAVKKFANSWAINEFALESEFCRDAAAAGFCRIVSEDISQAILPSAKRLYKAYWLGKPAAILYRLFRGKPTSLAANNVESALLQYTTLKKGWWKYRVISAVKA
ncbi:SAM-dependent methyltransferase [Flavisolibacter nicotianae]|uniref:SAM-dependent methyltransferase n=1 Tax=Flavisolibacter nicotianae TaxID=2364882 RepID=UPI000EB18528|nr:methyltransferase domain-containing protein [Flavisolibacter nicotianae]